MTIQEKLFRNALKGSKKYFIKYSDEVLKVVGHHNVRIYAEWRLDMINENEVKERCNYDHLEDCNTDDLLYELEINGIKIRGDSIVTSDLAIRFAKIVELDDPTKLTAIIEQLERENNLL
ncbi:hypothetical protein [Myroides odoratus]|uniref:hypothetical protein n=1 Tax=Myroides odoratus TaxID=256 RepID=UPI0007659F71|nr:hypothetical protein [Myroides odoratus]